jgi:hypothetical protein
VICDSHPEEPVSYYCRLHRELICVKCVGKPDRGYFSLHDDHPEECVQVKKKEVQEFVDDVYNRLRVKNQRIVSVLDEIYTFQQD